LHWNHLISQKHYATASIIQTHHFLKPKSTSASSSEPKHFNSVSHAVHACRSNFAWSWYIKRETKPNN
jgi:hypothetical protein